MSKHISVRIDRCVGCHTCELACAIAHSQSQDIETMIMGGENPGYRIHVETYGPRSIPISCQHCEEAACALACPTGAVKRNAPGKPVLVEDERCIGCSMCVQACPFGVIALRPDGKIAFKCDLCIGRLAQGLEPACVSSCPTKALTLQEDERSNKDKRRAAVQKLAEAEEAGAEEVEVLSG
jgi:carbon-monoxide dehydrogenase iron sulfur subunit